MSVTLDGRKIGSMHITRVVAPERVITTDALKVNLTRTGDIVHITNTERDVETPGGRPLAFNTETTLSKSRSEVRGSRLGDGSFRVTSTVGGQSHHYIMGWPPSALMAEGQRLAMRAHGLKAGTEYHTLNFDPTGQIGVDVSSRVIGTEPVSLPGGTRVLHHIRQRLMQGNTPRTMDLWVDNHYRILKGSTDLLGFRLEMLACSKTCAQAPNQSLDLLTKTMVDSPRPLPPERRAAPMRYLIQVPRREHFSIIDTSEQRATRVAPGIWVVDVGFTRNHKEAAPDPSDTAATDWLQASSPIIVHLAHRAVGDATGDRQRVQRMSTFVHDYISTHSLNVGYASALETAKDHRGDCTEHAVLLAAMTRALGIPARVVSGLAYAHRYAGHTNVFVPHLWVQAWVDHHWRSYDPTLGRFDSAHIALAIGDGDPWRYYADLDMLAKMRIEQATPFDELMYSGPSPSAMPGASAASGNGPGGGGR